MAIYMSARRSVERVDPTVPRNGLREILWRLFDELVHQACWQGWLARGDSASCRAGRAEEWIRSTDDRPRRISGSARA